MPILELLPLYSTCHVGFCVAVSLLCHSRLCAAIRPRPVAGQRRNSRPLNTGWQAHLFGVWSSICLAVRLHACSGSEPSKAGDAFGHHCWRDYRAVQDRHSVAVNSSMASAHLPGCCLVPGVGCRQKRTILEQTPMCSFEY